MVSVGISFLICFKLGIHPYSHFQELITKASRFPLTPSQPGLLSAPKYCKDFLMFRIIVSMILLDFFTKLLLMIAYKIIIMYIIEQRSQKLDLGNEDFWNYGFHEK